MVTSPRIYSPYQLEYVTAPHHRVCIVVLTIYALHSSDLCSTNSELCNIILHAPLAHVPLTASVLVRACARCARGERAAVGLLTSALLLERASASGRWMSARPWTVRVHQAHKAQGCHRSISASGSHICSSSNLVCGGVVRAHNEPRQHSGRCSLRFSPAP